MMEINKNREHIFSRGNLKIPKADFEISYVT
jgi:hypothetical protein